MNKQQFKVVREEYKELAGKIGQSINTLKFKVKHTEKDDFNTLEMARDNIGRVCFKDLFEKKYFPNFYWEIGKEGFLSHPEMDKLKTILPRFTDY